MARKFRIDMAGRRYGRLTGLRFHHRDAGGHAHWLFGCDCGAELVADGGNVRSGNTASCGCLHRERSAARLTVHGHRAGRRHDPTYRAWQAMNGAAGDAVCAGWRGGYPAFFADLGERPAGTVLRRVDEAGGWAPGNCRWVASSRPARAAQPPAAPSPARAASSQSRSAPAAAAAIAASIAR